MIYRGWWKPDVLSLFTMSNRGNYIDMILYKSECIPINSIVGYSHPREYAGIYFMTRNAKYKSIEKVTMSFFTISLFFEDERIFVDTDNFQAFLELLPDVSVKEIN